MKNICAVMAVLFLISLSPCVNAQDFGFEVGLTGSLGIPQGEFSDNVENKGWGGSVYAGYNLPNIPIMVGLDLGYLIYGSETRRERFSLTIPDATVLVENTNNIFLGHFLLRIQPGKGAVRPHLDGLIGFKNLFTDTEIRNDKLFDEQIAESTNSSDFAFSYGIGGGVKIRAYEGSGEKKGQNFAVYIDVNAKYLPGSEAEYLKEGSITRTDEGEVFYDFIQSKTDLLLINLGVSVHF